MDIKKRSISKGLGFGITSGIITTIGLIIGLYSLETSKLIIYGGILSIAIADAFSDAVGIHVSEESGRTMDNGHIWLTTGVTFISKLIIALTFIVPFLFLEIKAAVYTCVVWGLFLIILYNYFLAKRNHKSSFGVIFEHLSITILVIIITGTVKYLIQFLGLA